MPSWSREFNLQAQMVQLDETVLLPTKDGFENNIYATESPSASRTPWTIASKKYRHKINSYQTFSQKLPCDEFWTLRLLSNVQKCIQRIPNSSKICCFLETHRWITTCASRPSLSGHWILASASCNKFSTMVGPRIQL